MRELGERDIVLADHLLRRPESGELVLSTGERFRALLSVEDERWIATIGERLTRTTTDELAINLAYRVVDARELPRAGGIISLTVLADPLVLSWGNGIFGLGEFVELEAGR